MLPMHACRADVVHIFFTCTVMRCPANSIILLGSFPIISKTGYVNFMIRIFDIRKKTKLEYGFQFKMATLVRSIRNQRLIYLRSQLFPFSIYCSEYEKQSKLINNKIEIHIRNHRCTNRKSCFRSFLLFFCYKNHTHTAHTAHTHVIHLV